MNKTSTYEEFFEKHSKLLEFLFILTIAMLIGKFLGVW